jgi:hypothetical protein
MHRFRCRTRGQAEYLALTLSSEYPDSLTTRTGRTVRTELTRADVLAVIHPRRYL